MCKIAGVKDDEILCPPEAKILEELYNTFDGSAWVNNMFWLDETVTYCLWHGVSCDDLSVGLIKLELVNNGLSGVLGTRVVELVSGLRQLRGLDLNTNNIEVRPSLSICMIGCSYFAGVDFFGHQGTIQAEIVMLENLVELDLSNQKRV